MNNTNTTMESGFPKSTVAPGTSISSTTGSALAIDRSYINNLRRLSRNKCKCGGKLYVTEGMVLTSSPAQYPVKCDCCGHKQNVFETELIYEIEYNKDFDSIPSPSISPITTIGTLTTQTSNCNHSFDVKLINGNYVSYCTRCGRIGDSHQAPMPNFTCVETNKGIRWDTTGVPCIDPLQFTCSVEGNVTTTPNVDESEKVKAWSIK